MSSSAFRLTEKFLALVPQVRRFVYFCPECPKEMTPLNMLVIHFNDRHKWTREQIADWLEEFCVKNGVSLGISAEVAERLESDENYSHFYGPKVSCEFCPEGTGREEWMAVQLRHLFFVHHYDYPEINQWVERKLGIG